MVNVGPAKVKTAMRLMTRNGPHTCVEVKQFMASKRTGSYFSQADATSLGAHPDGHGYILHCNGHCAGVVRTSGGHVEISDASYPYKIALSVVAFEGFLQEWCRSHQEDQIVVFKLAACKYEHTCYGPVFMLLAA